MTTLSKFFKDHLRSRTCQDFFHTGTCSEHLINHTFLYALSNFKYFAPICLLPIIIKIRNINKKELRKTLEYYLGCSLVGTGIGLSINCLICLIRKIRGQFGYYSFLFIPSFLCSNITYLGSEHIINLFKTTVFQCMIETFFFMRKNILSRTVANSKTRQTYIFMFCSAIILHCKQMYNTQGFWLLKANPKIKLTDNVEECSKCDLHPKTTCKQYLTNGLRKYFILGLSLDIIKMLLSDVTSVQSQSKFVGKLKNFRIRSMSLLTTYIGIYRLTHCWLHSKRFYSDNWNHIISSFFAGSCYYLYPQSTLFSFAVVQAIHSFWKMFEIENADSKKSTLRLLLAIPYGKIIYAFAFGFLVHLSVFQPKNISPLAAVVANGIANKYPDHLQNTILVLKSKFEKDSLTN